jgi:uncharacterized protein (DUF1786 family)
VTGVVATGGAKTFDGRIQAVLEIHEGSVRPQTLPQLIARDHLAGVLEHEAKNLEWLVLQADAPHTFAQLARPAVELE